MFPLKLFTLPLPQHSSQGSVCPGPTLPTPGQPCSQLTGALECHYDYDQERNCCGRCAQSFTTTCLPDSSTNGSKVWQLTSPPCPSDCCGREGE